MLFATIEAPLNPWWTVSSILLCFPAAHSFDVSFFAALATMIVLLFTILGCVVSAATTLTKLRLGALSPCMAYHPTIVTFLFAGSAVPCVSSVAAPFGKVTLFAALLALVILFRAIFHLVLLASTTLA